MKSTTEKQKSVIGTLLIKPAAIIEVKDFLHPQMFDANMKEAADFIWGRDESGEGFSTAAVSDLITRETVRECRQLFDLENLEFNAREIAKNWMAGQYIHTANDTIGDLESGTDYFEAKSNADAAIELTESFYGYRERKTDDVLEAMNHYKKSSETNNLTGIPTGWTKLDEFTSGWQKGNLVYFAARPNMGKTTVMCEMLLSSASAGIPSAFFSVADLTRQELIIKLAFQIAKVPYTKHIKRTMTNEEKERVDKAFADFYDLPIHIVDRSDTSNKIGAIKDRARQLHDRYGIEILFADYVQKIAANKPYRYRNDEMGEVSEGLKDMAVLLNIPVISGSQLSRANEVRGGTKRPQMSDIRDSGNLEQDADQIYFIYRPEYYGIMEDEEGNSLKGLTEIISGKYRMAGELVGEKIFLWYENGRLTERLDLAISEISDSEWAKVPVVGDPDENLPF